MRIAVTGANGLVGRAVIGALLARGHQVRALVRFPDAGLVSLPIETVATGSIETIEDWRPHLSGIDKVIHLAARTHVPDEQLARPKRIRAINVTATLNLARSAARKKISHFIYLSSVKVHGDHSEGTASFQADDPFSPQDLYAQSKVEAELGLNALHAELGLNITIVRPPLVYGEAARGNFRSLCQLVAKSRMLPFGLVHNVRSLISAENLGSALTCVADHNPQGCKAYLVSDGADLSTPQMIAAMAKGLGVSCRMLPVPPSFLLLAARIVGREKAMQLLVRSFKADSSAFIRDFGWQPQDTPDEAIGRVARALIHQ